MSRLNEAELSKLGLSGPMIAWFRDVDKVVVPGIISLDINEIEALGHEFRQVKTLIDELAGKVLSLEIQDRLSIQLDAPDEVIYSPPTTAQQVNLSSGTFSDNHIIRADGSTGLQDSNPSIDDTGNVIVPQEVIEQGRPITRYALLLS